MRTGRIGNGALALFAAASLSRTFNELETREKEMSETTTPENTNPLSDSRIQIKFNMVRNFPENKWLSQYQLDLIEKRCIAYLASLPSFNAITDELIRKAPIFDDKTKLFLKNKWLVLEVHVINGDDTRIIPFYSFVREFNSLLNRRG